MGPIFGDTDDITFGSGPSQKAHVNDDSQSITPHVPQKEKSYNRPTRSPVSRPERRDPLPPRPRPVSQTREKTTVEPIQGGLQKLIDSMKPSFFPQGNDNLLRMSILSSPGKNDPFFIIRAIEGTLIFGTGFSNIVGAGTTYTAFPDMRLPYSEKDRLLGWILLTPGFDIEAFQMILETLGFPHVYGTREVIAYIRDNISDTSFLDRCRFSELFTSGVSDRKIGNFLMREEDGGLSVSVGSDGIVLPFLSSVKSHPSYPVLALGETYTLINPTETIQIAQGEIFDISKRKIFKHSLKFTFDTFYIDKNSVGIALGYTLKDREILAENGVLTFVLEEDVRSRAIIGHIFIDSRGFVHAQEMMSVHKEVLKGIRQTYEQAIIANERIERSELVHTLRRELTKYCFLLTGRTPG